MPSMMLRIMSDLVDWAAPERNKGPILDVLKRVLPKTGRVLEIASATGQHIAHFARELPALVWQPSDVSEEHLGQLRARWEHVGLENLLKPIRLDVTTSPWPILRADAIYNANMIHISPWETTPALFRGAQSVLPLGGVLVTYGPYAVDGEHTSESNAEFDASLRARDSEFGVRDVMKMAEVAQERGFLLEEKVTMPANNFCLVWRKHARESRGNI
jgi:SAM-dependent methyltransferase